MNTLELGILDLIQKIRCPLLDFIMKYITHLGDGGLIWILIGVSLFIFKKTRKVGLMILVGLVFHLVLLNHGLKPLVHRIRPCYLKEIDMLIKKPTDYSFPSGHTAAGCIAIMVFYLSKYQKAFIVSLILTIIIAFSRMYLYVHYPTDILVGALLGLLFGYIGFKLVNYFYNKYEMS